MPITNVAFLRAKRGHEHALGALLHEVAGPSRREPGCIDYTLHQSPDAPALWFVYENWRTPQDLEAHFHTEHLQRFAQALLPVLDGDITLDVFTPVALAAA